MKVIDLFCGCGGFSEGFRQAGFEVVLAVDNWEVALKSHELNHPTAEHWLKDISKLASAELPKADIIIGSPPCQGFSIANKHTRTCDTTLVDKFVSIVSETGVKFWCWENVPAATSGKWLPFEPRVVDCADYGVASHRKRKFCCSWAFPQPTHIGRHITIGEALKDLNDIGEGLPPSNDPGLFDRPNVKEWLKGHPRLRSCDVMRTVTTRVARDKRNLHYAEVRPYTLNEVKRFMGYPDDYRLLGSLSDRYALLGNSVPPPMSKALADTLGSKAFPC